MAEEKKATDLSLTVAAAEAGMRVDIFLAQADPSFSRSQIKGAIEKGDVRVNGRVPKAGLLLKEGDKVKLHMEPARVPVAVAQDIALDIVYEDSSLIVINKPAGMVVHPAPGNPDRTLVNALLHHCDELAGGGDALRPGIVHRIDKETSGLIVFARHAEAHRRLNRLFETRAIDKTYLALVQGVIAGDDGVIDRPLRQFGSGRVAVDLERGKPSATEFRVAERFRSQTLVEARPRTGRRHQIRVHLYSLGHPIAGDPVYGDEATRQGFARMMLHAWRLGLTLLSSRQLTLEAPIPESFQAGLRIATAGQ